MRWQEIYKIDQILSVSFEKQGSDCRHSISAAEHFGPARRTQVLRQTTVLDPVV
jgi:hypothetical protein